MAGGAFTIAAGDSYFEISKNLEIFTELYKELNIYYVDDTQPGKLMKTGIDAMLNSLDPYTQYIPESDMEDYRFMTTGQYGGIGALIKRKDDKVFVSEPYEGYPAMKAGIWAGDEIVEVDGSKIAGMDTEEVSKLLKGQAGSIGERHAAAAAMEPTTHTLTREEIKIPDVPYKGMIDQANKVGYIKLNSFTQTARSGSAHRHQGAEGAGRHQDGPRPARQRRWSAARSREHREPLRSEERAGGGDQGPHPRVGQDLQDPERALGRGDPTGGARGWAERQCQRDRQRCAAGPGPRCDRR